MEAGVREVKAKFSEYLSRAASGETIIVTDRGTPVAQITPLPDTRSPLEKGIEEGWVDPPRRTRLGDVSRFEAELSTSQVLDSDRGE